MSRVTSKTVRIRPEGGHSFYYTISANDTFADVIVELRKMGYRNPDLYLDGKPLFLARDLRNWTLSEQSFGIDRLPEDAVLTLVDSIPVPVAELEVKEHEINKTITMLIQQDEKLEDQLYEAADSKLNDELDKQSREIKRLIRDLIARREEIRTQLTHI